MDIDVECVLPTLQHKDWKLLAFNMKKKSRSKTVI